MHRTRLRYAVKYPSKNFHTFQENIWCKYVSDDFTEASSVNDTASKSQHRIKMPYNAYYLK